MYITNVSHMCCLWSRKNTGFYRHQQRWRNWGSKQLSSYLAKHRYAGTRTLVATLSSEGQCDTLPFGHSASQNITNINQSLFSLQNWCGFRKRFKCKEERHMGENISASQGLKSPPRDMISAWSMVSCKGPGHSDSIYHGTLTPAVTQTYVLFPPRLHILRQFSAQNRCLVNTC